MCFYRKNTAKILSIFQNINSVEMSSARHFLLNKKTPQKSNKKSNTIRKAQIMYGNSASALVKKCLSEAEYDKE